MKEKQNKDPAFLFYSSDFLTGVIGMTDEQIGIYIKLLCYQHQKGPLSEHFFLKNVGKNNPEILEKFEKDTNGNFYNSRLALEIEKRCKYSESRRKNRNSTKIKENSNNISLTHDIDMIDISQSCVRHMENENRNINSNIIILEDKGVQGEKKPFEKKPIEIRIAEFKNQVLETHNQQPIMTEEELNNFIGYWTEIDSENREFRREQNKYFQIRNRMERWLTHDKTKYKPKFEQKNESKVENLLKTKISNWMPNE